MMGQSHGKRPPSLDKCVLNVSLFRKEPYHSAVLDFRQHCRVSLSDRLSIRITIELMMRIKHNVEFMPSDRVIRQVNN